MEVLLAGAMPARVAPRVGPAADPKEIAAATAGPMVRAVKVTVGVRKAARREVATVVQTDLAAEATVTVAPMARAAAIEDRIVAVIAATKTQRFRSSSYRQ